jgi:hypothetical protein
LAAAGVLDCEIRNGEGANFRNPVTRFLDVRILQVVCDGTLRNQSDSDLSRLALALNDLEVCVAPFIRDRNGRVGMPEGAITYYLRILYAKDSSR